MGLDDAQDDGKPQPAPGQLAREEGVEDLVEVGRRDAAAAVSDLEPHVGWLLRLPFDGEPVSRRNGGGRDAGEFELDGAGTISEGLDGVGDQMAEDLLKLIGVGADHEAGIGQDGIERLVATQPGAEGGQAMAHEADQFQRLVRHRGLSEVSQHQAADVGGPSGGLQGFGQEDAGALVAGAIFEGEFEVAHDGAEEAVEAVGDGPGHPAQAVGLLDLVAAAVLLGLFRVRLFAAGDVMDHHAAQGGIGGRGRGPVGLEPDPSRGGVPG
ncbi:MAG: hypothetical protein M5U12_36780 [Verrucomicrobia bacterium]|nr:hypothetical protein [Verrucomicrobiota bacterium]